jgi:hypothetical protein
MLNLARKRYTEHRRNAKMAGIPFLLTFAQWWYIWRRSGKWEQRGTLPHQYCMARKGPDIGPYAMGNVKIITNEQNRAEMIRSKWTLSRLQHMSKVMKGNQNSLGFKHPPEFGQAITQRQMGKPPGSLGSKRTAEQRQADSVRTTAWHKERGGHSEATKELLRQRRIEWWKNRKETRNEHGG